MSHQEVFSIFESHPLDLLHHKPVLVDTLLADCDFDHQEASRLVELAQEAPQRCQISNLYIQAIATNQSKFLFTNLRPGKGMQTNAVCANWLIGRNTTCALTIRDWSVSRCHAILSHHAIEGFYITDLGSRNGTRVNRRRLQPQTRQILRDGDLLQLGSVQVEFFMAATRVKSRILESATYLQEVTYS
jgi:pSer/pThr/pTyr-binding forkhead associated (FHA) protein